MDPEVVGLVGTVAEAVITAGAAMGGAYLTFRRHRKEDSANEARKEEKQNARLEAIEYKLDVHNGYASRIGGIERSISGLDKTVALIQKDVEYLKKEVR